MVEKRFVIIDSKVWGDQFMEVLPKETSREEAERKTMKEWECLAPSDREETSVALACLAYDEEEGLVIEKSDAGAFDCLAAYTALIEING